MKTLLKINLTCISFIFFFFLNNITLADDTCVFQVTADDLPPNIVLLLDSGAEMEQVVWHSAYDNSVDYTPAVAVVDQVDVLDLAACGTGCVTLTLNVTDSDFSSGKIVTGQTSSAQGDPTGPLVGNQVQLKNVSGTYQVGETVIGASNKGAGVILAGGIEVQAANGFFNQRGYGIIITGGDYYLVDIPADLDIANYTKALKADVSDAGNRIGTWTINGRTITLPAEPATTAVNEVIDNANYFRYSQNYLNWLFFAEDAVGNPLYDGSALPDKSRFYYAKTAIMTVAKGTGYKAKFGIYYFANATGGSQAQPLAFAVKADPDGADDDGDGSIDEMDEILTPAFMNNINNMHTVTYSPLAEGLSSIGYYYSSPSSGASGGYCQQNFALVVSPGVSSEDQGTTSSHVPASLADYDNDTIGIAEGNVQEDNTNDGVDNDGDGSTDEADEAVTYAIPTNQNGSTYLDDVASYLYSNDIVGDDDGTGAVLYDNLVTAFSVGEAVTGGSSGATATITVVEADAGILSTSGNLRLENVVGLFEDNEALTGNMGGSALVNGTLYDSGEGYQNVLTYTVGFMGDEEGNLFLTNTSNNGNGNRNLYNTSDPEYGKYHFVAESPDTLSDQLLAAVNDIISKTSTFTAPVVPVTRTTSGDRIYMAFFKPSEGNFWEGNVTKFGISSTNEIVDANGNAATWLNGAIKDGAEPYWATIDWADSTKSNYISNLTREIYTYFGFNSDLTNPSNAFVSGNGLLTESVLGTPSSGTANIINYVRGADVFDEDLDGDTTENRSVITGDVLHSEPVIFQYVFPDGTSTTMVFFGANDGMLHAVLDIEVDAGGNVTSYGTEHWAFIPPDQLHRLKDMVEAASHQSYIDATPRIYFRDVNHNGIVEEDGDVDGDSLQDDMDGDGDIDGDDIDYVILICGERKGGSSYIALDITDPSTPKYLWRVTNYYDYRSGTIELTAVNGTWQDNDYADHFADDNPVNGQWDAYVQVNGAPVGNTIRYDNRWNTLHVGDKVFSYRASSCAGGDCYSHNVYGTVASISEGAPYNALTTTVISQLGESWSEPRFGLVKTSDGDTVGTPACFIGGGYSSDNSKGKAVVVLNVLNGAVIKTFTTGMNYSIPSTVTVIDGDSNGFVDKLYVGDLGGQIWRIGSFTYIADDPGGTYSAGDPLPFPQANENINRWSPEILFLTDASHTRKFFYPPSVGLETGFDVVFAGTGDREDACSRTSTYPDMIYCIKDTHSSTTFTGEELSGGVLVPKDLVDVTNIAVTPPNLKDPTGDVDLNGYADQGWFFQLVDGSGAGVGEKVLAEGSLFYKVLYITTFTPNDEPCVPGGEGKLYALSYLTGEATCDFDNDGNKERSVSIGGGIPSKPVIIITENGVKMYISVGSTNPDANSEDEGAGILSVNPNFPDLNFFYLWWNDFI